MKQELQTNTELILVVGDIYVPSRVQAIPEEFKKIFLEEQRKSEEYRRKRLGRS